MHFRAFLPALVAVIASDFHAAAQELRGTYVRVPRPTPPSPFLDMGTLMSHPGGEWTIYMNRNGGTYEEGFPDDARANRTTIGSGTIPAFGGDESVWQEVMQCVRDLYAPFNVYVTDEEPDAKVPYIESVVGGHPTDLGLSDGIGGIAPMACEPVAWGVTFSFADTGWMASNPHLICVTVGQETAHAFGLDHAFECSDIMTYLEECGTKDFQDVDAQCGEYGPRPCACGGDTQNSHRQLLTFIGPHDIPPPPRDVGLPCETGADCHSDLCVDWGDERVCAETCDFTKPTEGCSAGFVCRDLSCGEGACVPGFLGVFPNGEHCFAHSQCASGLCADLPDGRLCARPCSPNRDACRGDGRCEAIGEACGGCVGEPDPKPDGSSCTDGGECESGVCGGIDPDAHYCTSRCGVQNDCGEGFLCEAGYCYVEGDGTLGAPCGDEGDCVSGVCAPAGYCSVPCDVRPCPEAFECLEDEDGWLCAPKPGELSFGQACETNDDCHSNVCVEDICTRPCESAACPADYRCRQGGDGDFCVERAAALFDGGGCGCAAAPSVPAAGAAVLLTVGLLLRSRRRFR